MKDKTTENGVKKPIFKKWWFWVIIVVILAAIFGSVNNTTTNTTTDTTTQETSSDKFISEVKEAAQGAIGSEGESISDVVLKDGDLCITVDLSKADPAPFTIEDLALSRASSITDSILDLADYDSLWNTITVDFGDIGKVVCDKDSIEENEAGRYFPSESITLE